MTIKVIKFKKLTSGAKKFEITFNKNGKTYIRKFGARGMSDFTIHKDKERRERYITRHKKDLKTNDPMKPGYLSMYILWNKPSVSGSLADYKRRLNVYNRTGKFPKGITGSKKLNSRFGALVDFDTPNSYLNKLPGDVQDLIQQEVSASKLQKGVRGREWPSKLTKEFFDHVYKHYIAPSIAEHPDREISYKEEFNRYKYAPVQATEEYHTKPGFMGNWFKRVAKLPTGSFFERDKESVRQLSDIIEEYLLKFRLVEENDGMMRRLYPLATALEIHEEDILGIATSLITILIKTKFPMSRIPPDVLEEISDLEEAYIPDPDESFWAEAHDYWRSGYSNFGALVDFNTPNSYLNKLPGDVQNLIQKEVSASKLQKSIRSREWPSKLMKEFLDHVKKYYIEPKRLKRKRSWVGSNPQANYDQLFDGYKREPHLATRVHHTRPGFMGNWFRRLAKLPNVSFFKTHKSSRDINSMVREYLSKFSLTSEYYDSPHPEDAEDIASSLIAILIKSGFPISRIPEGVIEEISDAGVSFNDRYNSFWREAHIYWTNRSSRNSFGKSSGAPSNVVNKKLYMSIKAKIKKSIKGRRWGAYDSGRLVREYKAKGGKYSGGKGKTDLGRWYKEKWVDACAWPRRKSCGRKTAAKIAYCRPSKRADSKTPKLVQSLSKAQRKSRCTKKKRSPMKRVTKFGALVDFNIPNSYLNKLPDDVQDLIQREVSTSKLQKSIRSREWPSKLMKEFLDHVKRYYIEYERRSRQRGGSISSTQINYDQWFDDYKREPHVATEMHHTNPGFMGNWFRRLAKLPSVSFFKRQKSSIDITSMVGEYLSKFRIATEYDDSPLDIHSEDVEDIASSLIAILIKSRFPISRIPPGVLEDLRDNYVPYLDRYHSINRYHSFWREAHIYWETNWPSRNSFGQSTPDEVVPYGDGSWVIHCSYHLRGAHSTLRYKPLSVRPNDYSYHYGIHNDGTLKLWATGGAVNTSIPHFLRDLLINYYNTRCVDISKTTQTDQSFYISDQYGSNKFGYTTESAQNNMLKSLLSGNDVLKNLDNIIKKLCKGNFTKDKCQKLFTYFILNLYHTFNVKIPGGAPRGFKGITLKYKKSYNNNLKELLYLLQDHAFGTFKGARLASRLYEIIF